MQNELTRKTDTMVRFSLIVCVSLIFGITAKPYKPWNKIPDEAVQDTVLTLDDEGKISWRVKVKPSEDIPETLYDIDSRRTIWKSITGQDKDELYHPSVADLLKVQMQNLDSLSAVGFQTEPLKEDVKLYQEPEENRDHIDHPIFSKTAPEDPEQDRDEVYHKASNELDRYLAPLMTKHNAGAELHVAHSEPEKDEDDLYHRDNQFYVQPAQPVQLELLRNEVRIHLQPEEDIDGLYHKDVPQLIPYQDDTKANAPVYLPYQGKHSEPEEDLDGLYHQ